MRNMIQITTLYIHLFLYVTVAIVTLIHYFVDSSILQSGLTINRFKSMLWFNTEQHIITDEVKRNLTFSLLVQSSLMRL